MRRISQVAFRGVLFGALAVCISTSSAYAQRDAGAKARGEFGTGFWNSGNNSSYSAPARNYVPAYEYRQTYSFTPAPIDNRQSFSHSNREFVRGDQVVVQFDQVKIGKGEVTVGYMNRGESFEVKQVIDQWLGVIIEREGKRLSGWVSKENVQFAPTQSAGIETRQSYSYEPVQQPVQQNFHYSQPSTPAFRNNSSRGSGNEPWRYSKADPRRYED